MKANKEYGGVTKALPHNDDHDGDDNDDDDLHARRTESNDSFD